MQEYIWPPATIPALLEVVVSESVSFPYLADSRGLVNSCYRLTIHPELHDLPDEGLLEIARAIGSIPVLRTGSNEVPVIRLTETDWPVDPNPTQYRALLRAAWSLMRLFGVFSAERLVALRPELERVFNEGRFRCPTFAVPENLFKTELFVPFLDLIACPRGVDDRVLVLIGRATEEFRARNDEWMYAALQVLSRVNREECGPMIDQLEQAGPERTPEFRDVTARDLNDRNPIGYAHPLSFQPRREFLGWDGRDRQFLVNLAEKFWTVPDLCGASFVFPPGWVWLEWWQQRPWEILFDHARNQVEASRRSGRSIDRTALTRWMKLQSSALFHSKFDIGSDLDELLLPFREPSMFRL